ncbi:hypothetical protein [Microterricola pindariensis]|uniref:Integral membrane protein n=1 Tax=Microterricola pindariensis TaxID=478010 RepID=A0ABX5AUK5_9MICO|nr:hypothetical protein GY24_12295 [Microterricola pindariensis]
MTVTVQPSPRPRAARSSGIGRLLIAVYAVLALGAAGRSAVQIIERFDTAPLAFTLSAIAALVYFVATVALIAPGKAWSRVAWAAIGFEAAGVLVVGALSVAMPQLFPEATVWSFFGMGYLFIPLVLPWLGLWWLATVRRAERVAAAAEAA